MTDSNRLTHLDEAGNATMVDISDKEVTQRRAVARGHVQMQLATLKLIADGDLPKGDVLAVARIAGIQAAKKCSDLIPLCHPLALTAINVDFELDTEHQRVVITATCKLAGRTGVEMEALTAASVAALTIYDMCKAADKAMVISDLCLVEKSGGKSGDWHRHD